MSNVTAILLSWKRVANLPAILDSIHRWPQIGEVFVWNNNPDLLLTLPGAMVINAPRNFLGLARYCVASLANCDTIWFQDDDVLLEPEQFDKIHSAYRRDPSRIYGCRGRDVADGRYLAEDVYGECDIILGQTMLFQRSLLANFFRYATALSPEVIEDDILFSLSCGGPHFAVNVEPLRQMGWDDDAALWRRPDHFERRQRMVDHLITLRR